MSKKKTTHKLTANGKIYCGVEANIKNHSYIWGEVTCPVCLRFQENAKWRQYNKKIKDAYPPEVKQRLKEEKETASNSLFERQQQAIKQACDEFAIFLKGKNKSYDGSAFKDVMYKGKKIPAEDTLDIRITDKIRRLQSENPEFEGEDTEGDLLGYLMLKRALGIFLDKTKQVP